MWSPLHGAEPSASVWAHRSIQACPPPEPGRPRTPGAGADRTHAGHARLARKPGICADAAMPGSTTACSVISSRRSSAPSNKAGKQGRIAYAVPRCQQFRASGLNLVIAAIVFWNSTYMWRARTGKPAADAALGVDPVSLRAGALASRNSPSHRPRDPSIHSGEAGSDLFERVLMVNLSL